MAWNHSNILSIPFQSKSHPVATELISAQINRRFGKRCRKLIFKMADVAASLDFQSTLSYFVSTRRSDAPHQVSIQLDHSL